MKRRFLFQHITNIIFFMIYSSLFILLELNKNNNKSSKLILLFLGILLILHVGILLSKEIYLYIKEYKLELFRIILYGLLIIAGIIVVLLSSILNIDNFYQAFRIYMLYIYLVLSVILGYLAFDSSKRLQKSPKNTMRLWMKMMLFSTIYSGFTLIPSIIFLVIEVLNVKVIDNYFIPAIIILFLIVIYNIMMLVFYVLIQNRLKNMDIKYKRKITTPNE